jgi:hypothetical protein
MTFDFREDVELAAEPVPDGVLRDFGLFCASDDVAFTNRISCKIPFHFGLRRKRNSRFIPKCLNSSPCASAIIALASRSFSTDIRCSYQLIASASSINEAIMRAKVRVS